MSRKRKTVELDRDIGAPCEICGSAYEYRITLKCPKCNKKKVYRCESIAEAMAAEYEIEGGVTHECGEKMRIRRWRTHERHHISYKNDQTVLLCYLCHQRMHGNAAITHHPFKKEYPKDIEPFVFAARVTAMYVEHMPELQQGDEEQVEDTRPPLERKLNNTSH